MRVKFFDILSQVQFPQKDTDKVGTIYLKQLIDVSVALEKQLFKENHYPRDYATKSRSLIYNLNNPKNPSLRWRVLFGELSPVEIIKGGPEMF